MSFIVTENAAGGRQLEVAVSSEVDEKPFLSITISDPDNLLELMDVLVENASEADAFLQDVTDAVATYKANLASANPE